jgi:hypothetical protein
VPFAIGPQEELRGPWFFHPSPKPMPMKTLMVTTAFLVGLGRCLWGRFLMMRVASSSTREQHYAALKRAEAFERLSTSYHFRKSPTLSSAAAVAVDPKRLYGRGEAPTANALATV